MFLAGLVFSKCCKIVFTSSIRHWQISELGTVIGHLTDKPSLEVAVSQVADSPDWSTRRNVW